MNFLNVGPWELTVILIIAILLVGPQRMAELARTIGRVTSQLRKSSDEFLGAIQEELQATEHETRQAWENVVTGRPGPVADIRDEFEVIGRETRHVLDDVVQSNPGQEAG